MGEPAITKPQKGKALTCGQKKRVLNIFTKFCEDYPEITIDEVTTLVASASGISRTSIYRVRKEVKIYGKVMSPRRTRNVKHLNEKYDNFTKDSIRKIINEFLFRNEIPTLDKILSSMSSDYDLPTFSRSTLQRLLKTMKVKFVGRRILDEPSFDIQLVKSEIKSEFTTSDGAESSDEASSKMEDVPLLATQLEKSEVKIEYTSLDETGFFD